MSRPPNVLLINCDDLGWGDLGCYGSRLNATPTLDRLAAEGLRMDAFYAASPVCSPSRGALLTGRYPPRFGFGSFENLPVLFPAMPVGLAPTEVSIAKVLSGAGYATCMIGKWHCGDQPDFMPLNHGFDRYFGLPYSNDMGRQANTPSFLPPYPPLPLMDGDEVIEQQPDQASLTGRYVAESIRFMRAEKSKPWFLYLAHLYVHLPIYVQERFMKQTKNGRYGAAVESIDWATAVLLTELRALGLENDTIVIFTSDNGSLGPNPAPFGGDGQPLGGSNGPFRGTKGQTWEGGMRVPAIIRWPGKVRPGRTTGELATAMDLFPTLAKLCGARLPAGRAIDGRDISPLWLHEGAKSSHECFLYYFMDDLEAVRSGRFKLHFSKRRKELRALYDLEADPAENEDVIARHPDVVARLEELAERGRDALGDARLGRKGRETVPIGRVERPVPLTRFDPNHPYYMAEYDLAERG
ncbi:alkaline-phosphatase-like protein [Hyaloraphidium curvatum]|nr:alkaline-phosphatase-like protein [Hyaloraphidium curvatum]